MYFNLLLRGSDLLPPCRKLLTVPTQLSSLNALFFASWCETDSAQVTNFCARIFLLARKIVDIGCRPSGQRLEEALPQSRLEKLLGDLGSEQKF